MQRESRGRSDKGEKSSGRNTNAPVSSDDEEEEDDPVSDEAIANRMGQTLTALDFGIQKKVKKAVRKAYEIQKSASKTDPIVTALKDADLPVNTANIGLVTRGLPKDEAAIKFEERNLFDDRDMYEMVRGETEDGIEIVVYLDKDQDKHQPAKAKLYPQTKDDKGGRQKSGGATFPITFTKEHHADVTGPVFLAMVLEAYRNGRLRNNKDTWNSDQDTAASDGYYYEGYAIRLGNKIFCAYHCYPERKR